ncbi:unnamed protein product [Trichogramma brassicae]|uniref:Uncharacterized protein n=1 Tax=Trichogramma brassicae TaxID=86971 RepID=A0A6H5IBL9_9HYME|nr:unnamed protein product [Trichogramma brassicae]
MKFNRRKGLWKFHFCCIRRVLTQINLIRYKDGTTGGIYLLSAARALLQHHDVPPTLYETVWRSLHRVLSPHDVPYAGPRCHEETWEPEQEGVCSICNRLYSESPPPVNQWIPFE